MIGALGCGAGNTHQGRPLSLLHVPDFPRCRAEGLGTAPQVSDLNHPGEEGGATTLANPWPCGVHLSLMNPQILLTSRVGGREVSKDHPLARVGEWMVHSHRTPKLFG